MIPGSPLLVMDDPYGRIGDVLIFRYPIKTYTKICGIFSIALKKNTNYLKK